METISAILSMLASVDDGSVTVPIDAEVYPKAALRAFVAESTHCVIHVSDTPNGCLVTLTARDPAAARLQIGNALNDLLHLGMADRR
jgi:hypothetical protein